MALKISFRRNRGDATQHAALGVPRAEIFKRLFEAIAFLEELRADVPEQIRQSPARDAAIEALHRASNELLCGARLLVPQEIKGVKRASSA